MFDSQRQLVLLGPQPKYASLKTALGRMESDQPVALITAGWETDEHDDQELKRSIGKPAPNLNLFARTEQLFKEDPELITTLRARQDELRHLRTAYDLRLSCLLKAADKMIRRKERLIDLSEERESAIEMIRQLDRQYLARTGQIVDHYENILRTDQRPLVIAHRREIAEILGHCGAILISGGHVAIILNRLKIFGILETRAELPIIAWSGGAMALSSQIVLFHDSPPQGASDPEVLRAGMGLFQDVLPLPDGRTRLNLSDEARVQLFARRFDHQRCVVFDSETILERNGGVWNSVHESDESCLADSGKVVSFSA